MKTVKDSIDALYRGLLHWNNPYYDFGVPVSDYRKSRGVIQFTALKLQGDESTVQPLLRGYPYAAKIAEAGGAFYCSGSEVMLEFEGIKFRINSAEELFIVFEVFLMRCYRFCSSRDSVVVDIGMNAGISTLFFAREPRVKRIFSYELFKPTHRLGVHNLDLNAALAKKVKTFAYGLSNKSFDTTLDYSLSRKGRMGLKGLPHDENFRDVTRENVEVKDIGPVFREILQESAGLDVIVKIDCEGEEYNLIDRLRAEGALRAISVVMLEWHYERPARIEEGLVEAGFHVFSTVFSDLISGMIYASRRGE